jgi:hypothetical protein
MDPQKVMRKPYYDQSESVSHENPFFAFFLVHFLCFERVKSICESVGGDRMGEKRACIVHGLAREPCVESFVMMWYLTDVYRTSSMPLSC